MTNEDSSFAERCASFEAARAKARELRAASTAIREQVSATQRELAGVLNAVRATRGVASEHLTSFQAATAIEVAADLPDALPVALAAADLDADALDEVTAGLIAAYRDAVAADDGEMVELFGQALKLIGRRLAQQIGPKAAGVTLN